MTTETMPKLIIFEGADCTGKTTAALDYAKFTGAVYQHCGSEAANDPQPYFVEMLKPLMTGQDVVLDRGWMSDVVYGKLVRKWSHMTPSMVRWFEDAYSQFRPVTFICTRPEADILKDWSERLSAEYVKDEDQMKEIIHMFNSFRSETFSTHNECSTELIYPGVIALVNVFRQNTEALMNLYNYAKPQYRKWGL